MFFYLYPFFKKHTYRSDRSPELHAYGSNDAESRKDVPFLAFVNISAHLGDQIAQKHQFWGRE